MKFEVSRMVRWTDSLSGGVFDERQRLAALFAHLFAGQSHGDWGELPSNSVMQDVTYGRVVRITFKIEVVGD